MNKKYFYKVGDIYNLKEIVKIYRDKNNRECVETRCIKCGRICHMRASDIVHSRTNSCFCQEITHGLHKDKLYSVYYNMKDRCYNSNCHAYKNYGERGIKVCAEWYNDFLSFYNWALENGYHEGLSIDRINNDGDYSPNNCQWITKGENTAKANRENPKRKKAIVNSIDYRKYN